MFKNRYYKFIAIIVGFIGIIGIVLLVLVSLNKKTNTKNTPESESKPDLSNQDQSTPKIEQLRIDDIKDNQKSCNSYKIKQGGLVVCSFTFKRGLVADDINAIVFRLSPASPNTQTASSIQFNCNIDAADLSILSCNLSSITLSKGLYSPNLAINGVNFPQILPNITIE